MEGARQILTAGVFYVPFIAFIGFGLFVFILGLCTFITGSIVFILLATYGIYAALRDTGLIEYLIEKFKKVFEAFDLDILENINKSFTIQDKHHIPEGQALYVCHPHGILGLSWFYHFCHPLNKWPYTAKKPYLAIHSLFFKIPFLKEILLANHCIDASEETILSYLEKGESVAIITGGAEEMMYSDEKSLNIIMKKRKGYVKLARKTKVPIVPMISVNENQYFPQHKSFLWSTINDGIFRILRISFPMPSWKAMQNWVQILKHPLPKPIETFVLKPIEPQNKSIEAIRQESIKRIEEFIQTNHLDAKIIA